MFVFGPALGAKLLLNLVLSAVLGASSLSYDAKDEAIARSWITKAGHAFRPDALTQTDLDPLVRRLSGARVIGIGEVTHGTHQDEAFKVELIKALVRAGAIDTLTIECNRAAGDALDHYVGRGEGDPVAVIRSPSFFSIWRNDDFAGLIVWLRAWAIATGKPLHIIGVDLQDSGVDAAAALDFMARRDPAAAADIRSRLGALVTGADGKPGSLVDWRLETPKASYDTALAAAAELKDRLANAPADWRDAPGYESARHAAAVAWQGLFTFENEYKGADTSKLAPAYYNRRDDFMAANLMEGLGAGRAALWAHDEHVAARFGPRDDAQGWRALGNVLHDKLGTGYRTVGFTWSQAVIRAVTHKQGDPMPPRAARHFVETRLGNQRPGDFGHVFDPLGGDGWWIDLSARPHTPGLDRWGARPLWHGFAGWFVDPTAWQTNPDDDATNPPDFGYDIMVWFRHMGPARSWPEP